MNGSPRPVDRRRLLSAALALPVAAAASAPALALAAGAHADARLLELERQHAQLSEERDKLYELASDATERAWAQMPPTPEVLRVRPDDWFVGKLDEGLFFTKPQVETWREHLSPDKLRTVTLRDDQRLRLESRGREIVKANDGHYARRDALYETEGVNDLEDRASAADKVVIKLEQLALAERATTVEGLRAKARIAARFIGNEPDDTYEDRLIHNLLADLLR